MDMLKKARGKAMAAVKEVQKEVQGITSIMQTPSQQAAGYHTSSYQHSPYQQYGQQHPPQMQNFQSQYAGSPSPSQSYSQGQPQYQQYAGQNQYPNANQYSQYGQATGQVTGQQSHAYNQVQPQHGQQHQYAQQYTQQGQTVASPQGQQYSAQQVPPPYSATPSNQQNQSGVQGYQNPVYGSQAQTALNSPPAPQPLAGSPSGQQYQQQVQSPPLQYQNQSPVIQQYQQSLSSPIQQLNPSQYPGSPQSQHAAYSSPSLSQPGQSTLQQQTNQPQSGYFPSPTGQQNQLQQPNYTQNSPPPIPQGRPQSTSPQPNAIPNMPLHNVVPQHIYASQNQPPPVPPRQDISSPPPGQYSQQYVQPLHPQPQYPAGQVPTQQSPGQVLSPNQISSPQVSQPQQAGHLPQSPVLDPPPTFSASTPLQTTGAQIHHTSSPPPAVGNQVQQPFSKPVSPAQTPAPQQSHVSHTAPSQPSPQQSNAGSPDSNLTPAPLHFRPRPTSIASAPAVNSPTPPPQSQHQAFGIVPERSHSIVGPPSAAAQPDAGNPSRISAGSPTPPPPNSQYQAFGGPPRPFNSSTAPLNPHPRSTEPTNTSPPPNTQYQAFVTSGQSSPPNRVVSPQETSSPTPSHGTQYQPFVGTSQSPVQNYAAFNPATQQPQTSPPKPASSQPYRPASTDSQKPNVSRLSPTTQSPVQSNPQFAPPRPSSTSISPQSQFVSPVQRHGTPYQPEVSVTPQYGINTIQTTGPVQTFELPSGSPVTIQAKGPEVSALASNKPQAQSTAPIEYADGLMLADEDTHFVPAVRNNVPRLSYAPRSGTLKTRCSGFEPTLTDINQFFELRPDVIRQYNIPVNPGGALALCEYCFHTFIEPHPWLAAILHPRPRALRPSDKDLPQISFEKLVGCGMAFPRIRQVILGQAIPSRNIQPFLDCVKLDATIPPCSGEPRTGDYYGSHAMPSLALCKSCFECYIKNTAFEQQFVLMKMPSADQQWACDVGYSGYVQRILLFDIAQNPPNFGHFVTQTNKRLAMPPCTGHKQPIACSGPQGSTIFRSVKDNCGVFCSGCFHDKVVGTVAERGFGYEIEIDGDQKASLSCDLTFPFSVEGMERAVQANNFDVWHAPIVSGNSTQLCPSIAGHDEADLMEPNAPQWYCFKDYPNIEVCARCYGMQMVQAQAQELFVPITRPLRPGKIRQCYLSPAKDLGATSWDPMDYENTTAWRGQYLRNTISWCRDVGGDFTIAKEAAAKIAALPPPCGSELRKFTALSGRKFFGHQASNPNDKNDATILMCEECFDYTAKGTPMDSFFSNDLSGIAYRLSPEGHRCSTWSRQTKRRLREACLNNGFAAYAQYHHQREAVFDALWQSMRELEPLNALLKQHTANINRQTQLNIQMGGMRLAQQMNAQMNATIMGIGGSVAEAAASDTGYRYGNSTVGMNYLTPNGANAAMAQHEAKNLPGINLAMWEGASTERLTGEVQRRLEIQNGLREQWVVLD